MTRPSVVQDVETPESLIHRIGHSAQLHRTAFDGGRMTWRAWGAGPNLVLLHGGHGSWTHWIRNIPLLARTYRVLAADMPGYGDSDDLPKPHSLGALVDAVSAGINALLPPEQSFIAAAFSFGCTVAGELAIRQERRQDGLILVGPAGLGLTRPPMGDMVNWRGMSGEAERSAHRHNVGTLMIHNRSRVDDFAVYQQISNSNRTRFRSRDISHTDTLRRSLARTNVLLASIWGAQDATARGNIGSATNILRAKDPDASLAVIEDAGHWVQYESAEAFNPIMLSALRRLEARKSAT